MEFDESDVNFTYILQAAFMQTDPKSTKRHWWLDCLFALLGSAPIKVARKNVGEIELRCLLLSAIMLLIDINCEPIFFTWLLVGVPKDARKEQLSITGDFGTHPYCQFIFWQSKKNPIKEPSFDRLTLFEKMSQILFYQSRNSQNFLSKLIFL